jgi:hypothetical protein
MIRSSTLNTSKKSRSIPITTRPWVRFAKTLALSLFILPLFFLSDAGADPVLKIVSGRVKEIRLAQKELVLTYPHPVSRREEVLFLRVDEATGFAEGIHFEGLQPGTALSVDYLESEKGEARAVSIKKVPLQGIPIEKNPFF